MAAKQLTRSGEDQKPQPPSKWLSPNYVAVLLLVGIIGLVVSLCYVAGPCSTHHKTSSGEKMIIMDEVTLSYIVFILAVIPFLLYSIVIFFFITSITYGRCVLHQKVDPNLLLGELPGVSIVKPLMGIDPLLEGNLESHFLLNYPKFELLLCVQDDQDPAINLVNQLKERYPKVDAKLFIGGKDGIINPMVHNMTPGYENAQYEVIWISTCRIKASTDILLDMVGKLSDPKIGLVHQMPFTVDRKGLAATVEKVYFGTNIARNYLTLNVFNMSCVTGMSYVFRKSDLDELHGLEYYGRYLAEDFFIAKALHDKGFRHQVAAVPAQQNVASTSIVAYKDRMVRWLRLRLNMMPLVAAILEPMSECFPIGVYMAWGVWHFFKWNPYIFFTCHLVAWFVLDYLQLKGIQNGPLMCSKLEYLVAWLIRESLTIWIYFEALLNPRRIQWGKRTYRISLGGDTDIVSDRGVLPI